MGLRTGPGRRNRGEKRRGGEGSGGGPGTKERIWDLGGMYLPEGREECDGDGGLPGGGTGAGATTGVRDGHCSRGGGQVPRLENGTAKEKTRVQCQDGWGRNDRK